MVAPIKRDNLRKRLAQTIFEEIIKGEFKPGDRIVEGSLARELGVAQSSLREALHELEYQGLVTKHDNRGTFVTVISLEEMDQLYAVRQQLEPFAATLAHARITPEAHSELSRLLDKMFVAGKNRDAVELAHVDLEFHQMIWQLAGNQWLERALRLVGPQLLAFVYVRLVGMPTYDFRKVYDEHKALLTALTTGTPEDAKQLYAKSLETSHHEVARLRVLQSAKSLIVAKRRGSRPTIRQSSHVQVRKRSPESAARL